MARQWSPDELWSLMRAFQPACVLAAAAELDVFGVIGSGAETSRALASKLGIDLRATTILLDALAAIELLTKDGNKYRVPPSVADALTDTGSHLALNMVRHQANCLHRWAQLAAVTQSGKPAERRASIRGEAADQAAFIGAMNDICEPIAAALVDELRPLRFRHLLDVGGASGTWTIAFLRVVPDATATIFDLPEVIPLAQRRIAEAQLTGRVKFAAGDFYTDDLPGGADLVWLSAIVHQNSREQNRELFGKVRAALVDGGQVLIRDVVMDESRIRPAAGALFAVNMLVATPGGGTFTFAELREDLEAEGFADVTLLRQDEAMNSIVRASK